MARKEKEFHPGQNVLVVDIESGIRVQGVVHPVYPFSPLEKIIVKANGEKVCFDSKTLRGKTVFGPCVLMHIKA